MMMTAACGRQRKLGGVDRQAGGRGSWEAWTGRREAEEVGRCGQAGGKQRKLGGVDRQAGSRGRRGLDNDQNALAAKRGGSAEPNA